MQTKSFELDDELYLDYESSEDYWLDELKRYYGDDCNIEDEYDDYTQYLYNR